MNDTRRSDLTTFTPPRRLTRMQWAVVAHLYRDELDYARTAERLGISLRTVQMHVERASTWLPGHGPAVWKVLRWAEVLLEMGHNGDDDAKDAA